MNVPVEPRAVAVPQDAPTKHGGIIIGIFHIYGWHRENHDLLLELWIEHDFIAGLRRFIGFNVAPGITCAPVGAVLFRELDNVIPIKVARDGENQVIGGIAALPIIAHLLNAHIANTLARPKHIMSQRMTFEIDLHHTPERQVVGLIF